MKKSILSMVAAGALAVAGAASAQDLGTVLGNILGGIGAPGYSTQGQVVLSAPPPGAVLELDQAGRPVYDEHNRLVYRDASGHQISVVPGNAAITGYDAWGRPIYGSANPFVYGNPNYAYGTLSDRDGDGVPDAYDRWPDDPRYR